VAEAMMLKIKRVYEETLEEDGARFLVERLWPRGIKKEDLKLNAWLKDVAPSPDLRAWYQHDAGKWEEFQERYRAELKANTDRWKIILEMLGSGDVTLLYSSRETEHNSALVLKRFLDERLKDWD